MSTDIRTPLSPDHEAEIRERVAKATPGPWCTDGAEIYQGAEYEPGVSEWVGETCRADDDGRYLANAEFIAHARTDVPALFSEVGRLRADLQAADDDVLEAQRHNDATCEAAAALDRVRAWLDRRCHEPHLIHDHECRDDIRRVLLAVIDGRTSAADEDRDRRWQEAAAVEANAGRFGRRRAARKAQRIRAGVQR